MAVAEGYDKMTGPPETKEEIVSKVNSRGCCVDWMIWLVMAHLWVELITKTWKLVSVWFIKNTVSDILKINGTSINCSPIYLKERYTLIPAIMA
jgi:hypothetical protein